MKEIIKSKLKNLNEWYDYYLIKLEDVGETDYLNNRLSNTNITKYTDEMCLRDILRMLGEIDE